MHTLIRFCIYIYILDVSLTVELRLYKKITVRLFALGQLVTSVSISVYYLQFSARFNRSSVTSVAIYIIPFTYCVQFGQ